MQKLIEGLLAYSRSRSAITGPGCQQIFSLAVSNLSASIQEASALVTRDDLPMVLGDETQLLQLFQNLISNAVKYRRPEAEPHVHISSFRKENHFVFSVRDNGIGIEQDNYDRIFQIFQRLHSHDQYAGAGIGLAVCKRIVERHHGRIWIESVPGKGSTFIHCSAGKEEKKLGTEPGGIPLRR
jgi:light-regulated signal transduction histidine kinase (bacteriophytochrome)